MDGGQCGFDRARPVWPPEPGFFKLRLVARGWAVPARIVRAAVPVFRGDGEPAGIHWWQALIDGISCKPNLDPARAEHVARIWHGGERIDELEYNRLLDLGIWARAHEPRHPAANPLRPINPSSLRPLPPRTPLE